MSNHPSDEQVRIAADVLGVEEAYAFANSCHLSEVVPMEDVSCAGDAYYFWDVIRGGLRCVVGEDGGVLAAASCVAPAAIVHEYIAGRRSI